jgi:hypothetical protein
MVKFMFYPPGKSVMDWQVAWLVTRENTGGFWVFSKGMRVNDA